YLLTKLGLSWISARSKHPKQDKEAQALYKKNFKQKAIDVLPTDTDLNKVDVWFQDETRIGQQGSITRIWAEKGTRPRQFVSSNLNTDIFGAVCPAKDKALGLMLPVANTAGMIEHLRLISQATAKDRQALVIVDRAGWHMTKAIRCFSNVTLLPLPPYSPELNPVEQLWQQIKQRFLSNTTFQNYDDVIERSCQAWNEILSEDGFIKNLCSREWSFLV
ncbi:Mobile element protein, partial [uncultured Gammaproteobacteria bacterium]